MATRVHRSIEQAEATVDALLTLASSELAQSAKEPVDLATAAEDAIHAAGPTIAERGLTVEAALEPARTRGDRVLLERMIANLVDNAVRHNDRDGWVSIRTSNHNDAAMFEISNTGPRVTDEQIPSLFEPFSRAQQRINSQDGLGLGLSIASAIATAHGATITTQGRPDGGLRIAVAIELDRAAPGHGG